MMVHAKRECVVLCDVTCKCCIGWQFLFVYVEGGDLYERILHELPTIFYFRLSHSSPTLNSI